MCLDAPRLSANLNVDQTLNETVAAAASLAFSRARVSMGIAFNGMVA